MVGNAVDFTESNSFRVWDLENRTEVTTRQDPNTLISISTIGFSPAGNRLAMVDQLRNVARLLDITSGEELALLHLEDTVSSIESSPDGLDGRWLVSAGAETDVLLWEVENTAAEPRVLSGHTAPIRDLAFNKDSEWLATANDDQSLRLWEVNEPDTVSCLLSGYQSSVRQVSFSADGQGWPASIGVDASV